MAPHPVLRATTPESETSVASKKNSHQTPDTVIWVDVFGPQHIEELLSYQKRRSDPQDAAVSRAVDSLADGDTSDSEDDDSDDFSSDGEAEVGHEEESTLVSWASLFPEDAEEIELWQERIGHCLTTNAPYLQPEQLCPTSHYTAFPHQMKPSSSRGSQTREWLDAQVLILDEYHVSESDVIQEHITTKDTAPAPTKLTTGSSPCQDATPPSVSSVVCKV